ncbi:hypothetical protein ABZ508_01150 [Streptomyces lavendulocolor]|uniref:Uncharacterized protein n=1 Tax=Streptomyces lavendulocolor TaxID=67316 RepID=A0ABV2VXG7_9ACTN
MSVIRCTAINKFPISAGGSRTHDRKLRIIERATRTTPTQVEWRIDTSRRNWLLTPSRLLGSSENPAASPGFDERVRVATQDQDFCIRALADLNAILRTLHDLIDAQEGERRRD